MVKFILKRIGTMIIAMFMIILITFTLMHSIPGGPFTNTKGVPEEVTQAMEAKVRPGPAHAGAVCQISGQPAAWRFRSFL